jgi:hypothetical protein
MCYLYLGHIFMVGLVFERFTVNMFNLMRNIIRCEAYKPAKSIEGDVWHYF